MGNLLGGIKQFAVPMIKGYGKQLGQTSKSGLNCYVKRVKNGTKYTMVDPKTSQIVRTKYIYGDKKSHLDISTYDNKFNLLSNATISHQPAGYGLGSHNQFARKTRIIHQDYNKFGQVINSRDTTITPNANKPKAEIFINNNGNLSKTYLNTLDNTKRTINCVE